ncbi:JAB-like toxin 1 [Dysgonomonas alginatilytica]|uniref:JAB-like toxin 1 n=1 Tax=Dysgonomonas alginatilytica TaxID=1605892 RepID=A0A2V3PKF7_9BACT|nr:JAB-like toxin 1 domain-containing protein [Dysgonomonas alginatilytica]PXV59422.1 JAB-like toxin 1 [Dysgonomonas alginatilytica]
MDRINPDGRHDYRLDRDGNMHFVKETEASNHTIYATNAKGNINTKNSINVDKYVIGGKETVTGVQGRRSDGSIETSTIDIYTSVGDRQSTALFEFASKNTDVEWSQTKTTQNGLDVNYIATSHSGNTDVGQSYVINRVFLQNDKMSNQNSIMGLVGTNIREANHSHPNGSTIVSGGDANLAKTLQSRFPNAKMHNYTPNDGKYTFFDEYSEPGLLPVIEIVAPRKKK